jgi:hypothetical protein
MPEREPDKRKQLAFEESLRALDMQSEELNDLRGRTGILLTAASLTATFVGSRALDNGFDVWTAAAIGLFIATGGFCLGVLSPSGGWNFVFNATTILDGWIEASPEASLDEMHAEFARTNQQNWKSNDERLRWLN